MNNKNRSQTIHTTQNDAGRPMQVNAQAARSNLSVLMASTLLSLALLCGMTDTAQARVPQAKQGDTQADREAGEGRGDQGQRDTEEDLPTITLTAPANNSASLYPAAFAVEASVAWPGKAGEHRDKREGVEIEFLADGRKFAEAERAPYRASFTPPKAGIHTLTVQIRYGEGKRTILSNPVTVISDVAPTVSLTAPASNTVVTAPATFALSANAAASIGSIAKVEFYSGATLIGTATSAPYNFTWSNVPYGTYSLTAKATDNYGFSTTSSAVTVISNAAPTVSLTGPAANTVSVAPGSFTLTANANDVDGSIARVEFYNGTTLLGTATAAPYTFTWNNVPVGKYSLTAIATDNYGATTTSVAIPVISDAPPTVSLTGPAANAVSTAPGSFTLTASAGSAITSITKVEFYNGTTLLGTATTAPYTYTWSNVAAGTYNLAAKATDGYGVSATSASVPVISNAPPTVSLTAPANNASYTTPSAITLTATAADSDGSIAKVEFYNGTTLLGTATAAPYSFTWNNAPVGTYSLTAVATDNLGAATTSTATAITVIAPPVVGLTSPANNTVVLAPASFTLTANATSAGTISKVEFYASNGTANTLIGTATSAPYSYTWNNVVSGSYSLTAVATDGNGASTTSAPVSVTSNAAPTVSLTSPAANAVSIAPGSFTLTANATDPDGTVARVEFYASNGTTNTLVGTATAVPYTFNWSNVALGSYSITAVATDTLGASTTSSAVSVTVNTGAKAYYIVTDHLNTPRRIVDGNGNVVWENNDPFGNAPPNPNPAGLGNFDNPLRFPGQYFDKETNLNYNFFRDYDPATGRYIQSDLIGLGGGNFSTYPYVKSNPLRYTDRLGLCGPLTPLCIWIAANSPELTVAVTAVAEVSSGVGMPTSGAASFTGRATQELTHDVYLGLKNSEPVYAGITSNIANRACQHGDRFDDLLKLTSSPVTKDEARAIEQALINSNPQFQNQINSIAPTRSWYDEAVQWGQQWLSNLGK